MKKEEEPWEFALLPCPRLLRLVFEALIDTVLLVCPIRGPSKSECEDCEVNEGGGGEAIFLLLLELWKISSSFYSGGGEVRRGEERGREG